MEKDIFGLKVLLNAKEAQLEAIKQEVSPLESIIEQLQGANWFRKTLIILQHAAVIAEQIIKIIKIVKENGQ
jgi:hypothetical protein